jgi:hypothetical protein
MSYHGKHQKCTVCKKTLDGHTSVGEKDLIPKEGDISICVYCGTIYRYNAELTLHQLTDTELRILAKTEPSVYVKVKRAVVTIRIAFERFTKIEKDMGDYWKAKMN